MLVLMGSFKAFINNLFEFNSKGIRRDVVGKNIYILFLGKPLSVCPSVRSLFSEMGHRTNMKFGGNVGSGDLIVRVKL